LGAIALGISAAIAVGAPAAVGQTSVKEIFEKYKLLGTFAWDCSKPASPGNMYYVHRALDGGFVQRDMMRGETDREWSFIVEQATPRGPDEIAVSGTREGQPTDSIYRVEPRRMRVLEGTVGGKKEISGGRFPSGRESPWLNKCDPQ
jgi:hypothetical protein